MDHMRVLQQGSVQAPAFELLSDEGESVELKEFKGHWLVLYFFPSALTPYCKIEAKAFQKASGAIANLGASIVGISTDAQQDLKEFATKFGLTFPLLSDPGGTVGSLYGCLLHVPLLGFNFDKRTTFLISPESKVVRVFHDVDPHTAADEVVQALEELVIERSALSQARSFTSAQPR